MLKIMKLLKRKRKTPWINYHHHPSIWMTLREISVMLKIELLLLKDSGIVMILKDGHFGKVIIFSMKDKEK